jgi:ubiquinone/menaquinone biosynthesis C-methylase UbiE
MSIIEIMAILLLSLLLVIILSGLFRLNKPRKVNFEGIEDSQLAKAYDRISRMPQFKLIRQGFVKELKKHGPVGTVVDIGCGPGYLLQVVAKELPNSSLVGVDISDEMVKTAKANFKAINPNKEVEFKQGSTEHLPFRDSTQDFVISTFSLHHWNEPRSAFNEIYRVLKPGGQMLVYDFRRDARRLLLYLLWFAQNIVLRIIGGEAITKIGEPLGSLLSSYTTKETKKIMQETFFNQYVVKGKFGSIYIYAKKN